MSSQRQEMTENELGKIIVDCAVCLHMELGPGLLETVYEVLLAHLLPLKPYLLLFLIHRYRVAFECPDHENKESEQTAAGSKYHQFLALARVEKDPMIGAIANDIDKQSYLYIGTKKHP